MTDNSKMNKDEQFLLKIVQPSLLGFMDGSISTLAPVLVLPFLEMQRLHLWQEL